MLDERYTLHPNGSTPRYEPPDDVDERRARVWAGIVMDRMRPVVGMLWVVLSLASWWLLAEAVDATLSSTYKWRLLAQMMGGG